MNPGSLLVLTSPCPRRGRREPKVSDWRGATLADATSVAVLLSGGRTGVSALRLDESTRLNCLALHLSRRHRFAAYADLTSDKEWSFN
jgi:hypothetical protein